MSLFALSRFPSCLNVLLSFKVIKEDGEKQEECLTHPESLCTSQINGDIGSESHDVCQKSPGETDRRTLIHPRRFFS